MIARHAYVPEHLPGYVGAISQAEPYLIGDHLCYRGGDSIVFIGYPLTSPFDAGAMMRALGSALSRFVPESVVLTAPTLPALGGGCRARDADDYYRLDLSGLRLHPKVASTVRRAARELRVERADEIGAEHIRLIAEFLDSRPVGDETRYIYERIRAYVSSVSTARVFSARDRDGRLVAFDVAEFGAGEYAFYQFNVRARTRDVPGASDLLLHEVIRDAREQGKGFVNLGLGVNAGVARFKRKWGGVPFLRYECGRYRPGRPKVLDSLLGTS